jgi:hypothetical protein
MTAPMAPAHRDEWAAANRARVQVHRSGPRAGLLARRNVWHRTDATHIADGRRPVARSRDVRDAATAAGVAIVR